MNKFQKLWWITWGMCLILCLANYGYMLLSAENTQLINIEHKFYVFMLMMAAVSLAPLKSGKFVLWFILFCGLATIYNLPELQKITALEACAEGKCPVVNAAQIP